MCVFLLLLLASCTEEIQCCLCGFVLFVGLSDSVTVFGTLGLLEGSWCFLVFGLPETVWTGGRS